MQFRVLKYHTFWSPTGKPIRCQPGDPIQLSRAAEVQALKEQGTIEDWTLPNGITAIPTAPSKSKTFRVGCFMHTSKFYSGGRIHLYQFAWTMAQAGAEVYLVTDNNPVWERDYPKQKRLQIVTGNHQQRLPDDLDLLFTDGKNAAGGQALSYKLKHPNAVLCCLNFETPNWVAEFDEKTSARMSKPGEVYKHADLILCNSNESLKYFREWMEVKCLTGILPPAANTVAPKAKNPINTDRPYVVWSARSSAYKGCNTIIEAITEYDGVLDLVMVGRPTDTPVDTTNHRFISFKKPISDGEKLALMRDAVCVAAPSLFEGYGMVPGEALISDTPSVVYDLPVLRQNYGDRLVYAKWNDPADFKAKLAETIANLPKVDKKEAEQTYGMKAMAECVKGLPFMNFNKRRVSAQMICYYGPTVQEALESVYPHADEILISYGPTELWKNVEPDNARELIAAFDDPDKKITVIDKDVWENKGEMRRACQAKMTGNQLLIVDADEIYHNLGQWIEKAPAWGCPRWVHFWHNLEHEVVGGRWGTPHDLGGCVHNHLRWSFWRRSHEWKFSKGVGARDVNGNSPCLTDDTTKAVSAVPETCIYHLGHCLPPDWMSAKHEFYLKRDGADAGRIARRDVWKAWNGKLGNCGDGTIQKVNHDLPELVRRAYAKIEALKEEVNGCTHGN